MQVQSLPGLLTVFFSDRPGPASTPAPRPATPTPTARWCRALLARGVYPPPSQFEAWFPSLAHGREHVERTVAAAAEAFRGTVMLSAARAGRCSCEGARSPSRWRRQRARDGSAAGPPQLAAAGRACGGPRAEYELLLEMILEGSLLHYGSPRVVRSDDPDLALLLGDQLYALGLSRLAELGDLDAVSELADLISLLAQAQAAGDRDLADAIWQAGAAAIGWGPSRARARQGAGPRWRRPGRCRAGRPRATLVMHGHRGASDARLFVDGTLTDAFNVI